MRWDDIVSDGSRTEYDYSPTGLKTATRHYSAGGGLLRLVRVAEGGYAQQYEYDANDNRIVTVQASGNRIEQRFNDLGQEVYTQTQDRNGNALHQFKQYDVFGNLIRTQHTDGTVETQLVGAFNRTLQSTNEAGRTQTFAYDDWGRQSRVTATAYTSPERAGYRFSLAAQNIEYDYDELDRIVRITDHGTGTTTDYGYDERGNRVLEKTSTAHHVSDVHLDYDGQGRLIRWHDSTSGAHMNYQWDSAGNLKRQYTDAGYSAEAVDLSYDYSDDHLIQSVRHTGGSVIASYTYYENGATKTKTEGGVTHRYQYDQRGHLTRTDWTQNGDDWHATWQYDANGNVVDHRRYRNGSQRYYQEDSYAANNQLLRSKSEDYSQSDHKYTRTDYGYDLRGRINRLDIHSEGSENDLWVDTYYTADGLKILERMNGEDSYGWAGKSVDVKVRKTYFAYDANGNLRHYRKEKGNDDDRSTEKWFDYNADNQVAWRQVRPGDEDDATHATHYLYAGGKPVGDYGTNADGDSETHLARGAYNLVGDIDVKGDNSANKSAQVYTAQGGESLRQVAGSVLGNANLWFLLAEANGLDPNVELTAGQRLQIPADVQSGRITAETHALYDASHIIGSTVPNAHIKATWTATLVLILITVIIAIVAFYALPAVAGAFAALGTVGSYVAAGAVLGGVSSAIRQGAAIGLGLQQQWDSDQFWQDVGVGALQGGARGFDAVAKAGQLTHQLTQSQQALTTMRHARVAATALRVSAAAVQSYDRADGGIRNWSGMALAALGGVAQGIAEHQQALAQTQDAVNKISDGLAAYNRTSGFVSPWLSLAEDSLRSGDSPSEADYLAAVGQSFGALTQQPTTGDWVSDLKQSAPNLLIQGGVTAAMAQHDREAAEQYSANVLGDTLGNAWGEDLARSSKLRGLSERIEANAIEREVKAQSLDILLDRRTQATNQARLAEIGHLNAEAQSQIARQQQVEAEQREAEFQRLEGQAMAKLGGGRGLSLKGGQTNATANASNDATPMAYQPEPGSLMDRLSRMQLASNADGIDGLAGLLNEAEPTGHEWDPNNRAALFSRQFSFDSIAEDYAQAAAAEAAWRHSDLQDAEALKGLTELNSGDIIHVLLAAERIKADPEQAPGFTYTGTDSNLGRVSRALGYDTTLLNLPGTLGETVADYERMGLSVPEYVVTGPGTYEVSQDDTLALAQHILATSDDGTLPRRVALAGSTDRGSYQAQVLGRLGDQGYFEGHESDLTRLTEQLDNAQPGDWVNLNAVDDYIQRAYASNRVNTSAEASRYFGRLSDEDSNLLVKSHSLLAGLSASGFGFSYLVDDIGTDLKTAFDSSATNEQRINSQVSLASWAAGGELVGLAKYSGQGLARVLMKDYDAVFSQRLAVRGVGQNNNLDILHQAGELEKDANGFYRTTNLGTHTSISELMQSGALPGSQGVTLTDRTVRFGELYDLGTLGGRKIEFALTTERVDGKLVKRLYSGNDWVSPVPKDSRLIGHVHPNETITQMWPSPEDMNVVNARYFRELLVDPAAQPKPTRIFWGPGNSDNTIFYPGFGKLPLNNGG